MGENFTSDLFFIVVVLAIMFLLGFIIAWLLRNSKIRVLEAEIVDLKNKNSRLRSELEDMGVELKDCKKEYKRVSDLKEALNSRMMKLNTELMDCEKVQKDLGLRLAAFETVNFDGDAAKLAMGKKIKQDDLTLVEGIGPKIAGLLNDDGISTWLELSNRTVESIDEVLKAAGDRFAFHKPGTWPRQAELAAKGEWTKLKEWQDYLDGGVEPSK